MFLARYHADLPLPLHSCRRRFSISLSEHDVVGALCALPDVSALALRNISRLFVTAVGNIDVYTSFLIG